MPELKFNADDVAAHVNAALRGDAKTLLPNNPAISQLTFRLNIIWREVTHPELADPEFQKAVTDLQQLYVAVRTILEVGPRHLARFPQMDTVRHKPIFGPLIAAAKDYHDAQAEGFPFVPPKLVVKWHGIVIPLRSVFEAALPDLSKTTFHRFAPWPIEAITGEKVSDKTVKDWLLSHQQ